MRHGKIIQEDVDSNKEGVEGKLGQFNDVILLRS